MGHVPLSIKQKKFPGSYREPGLRESFFSSGSLRRLSWSRHRDLASLMLFRTNDRPLALLFVFDVAILGSAVLSMV